MISYPRTFLLIVLVLVVVPTPSARADWPMARHDGQRTGEATGVGELRTPGSYWTAYLGGKVTAAQALRTWIDGTDAVVFVSAGRVHAATLDGQLLWRTNNLDVNAIASIADLDGDGESEVVVQSAGQVFVLGLASGMLRWAEPRGEMGTIGGVRVADVDGDNLDDVFIQECSCCAIHSDEPGLVYSFSRGTEQPRVLWHLPYTYCGGSHAMLVDDLTGDGMPDVTLSNGDDIRVLDGSSGAVLGASPDLGSWVGMSWCTAADVVGSAGKELLCALGTSLAEPGTGHRMFALQFKDDPPRLDVVWSRDVGERDQSLELGGVLQADLDGDDVPEMFATGATSSGAAVTVVVDSRTGDIRGSLAGEVLVGPARVDDSSVVLLTSADNKLSAWDLDPVQGTGLTRRWTIKYRRAITTRDWSRSHSPLTTALAVADVDQDGRNEVLTVDTENPWIVHAHSLASPTGAQIAQWTGKYDTDIVTAWQGGEATWTFSGTDGRLTTVGPRLQVVLGSVRAGGYYDPGGFEHLPNAVVVGDLDGDGADDVIVPDSRRALLALDPRGATNAGPPRLRWERVHTFAPSVVAGLGPDGSPGVACRRVDTGQAPAIEMVAALDRGGATTWQTALGTIAFEDVVSGDFDGDATPDLAIQWGAPDDLSVRTTAVAGVDGHVLWTAMSPAGPARFPSGAAVTDWNGDGIDDIVYHFYGTRVLSGIDGTQLASGGPALAAYFMTTLVDVSGDGLPEVSLHGGQSPSATLARDLSTQIWTSTDNDRPYPYAATSTCASGPVLIGGSWAEPSRLKVTLQAGTTPGSWQSLVLAGGSAFVDTAAANAAGVIGGQLTSVHVHSNLTGLGRPTAVVGSSDGWLYGVDPCTMALDFALNFGVPVGAVAFGDGDGDGLDELIVSTADGFLHGVKNAPIQGPGAVRDIDLSTGTDEDVDDIVTRSTLSASWNAVPGATGYEVTVALAEGGIVATPPWTHVDSTFVTISDLPLEDGVRYVVSVRALSAAGPSPDVLSDGVRVHMPAPAPDAGPGADGGGVVEQPGGCCEASTRGAPESVGLGLAILAALRRRRRRVG
ncbi:MAG: hypothetical protein H6708_03980 [Kofleriaceae bacterium]|nr:hypothetical protein [Kofleriaceae bacterium]